MHYEHQGLKATTPMNKELLWRKGLLQNVGSLKNAQNGGKDSVYPNALHTKEFHLPAQLCYQHG